MVLNCLFCRNMKLARFDKGLKDDRNLDVKDDEFHNTQEKFRSHFAAGTSKVS